MVEQRISNIRIRDKKIEFNCENKYENVILKSSTHITKVELNNNSIDIEKLVKAHLDYNQNQSIYSICTEKDNEIKDILVDGSRPKGNDYICTGLQIEVNKMVFSVDVYINIEKQLIIKVRRIRQQHEGIICAKAQSVYIGDNNLNLHIELYKTTPTHDNIEELKIDFSLIEKYTPQTVKVIIFNEIGEEFETEIIKIEDNKLDIEVDLTKIVSMEGSKFRINILADLIPARVNIEQDIKFRNIVLKNEGILNSIQIKKENKQEDLVIEKKNKIEINPTLSYVEYNNEKLEIRGDLNTNIYIDKSRGYSIYFVIKSRNENIVIEEEATLLEDEFIYNISNNELVDIKNAYSGIWDICVQLRQNEKVIDDKKIQHIEVENNLIYENKIKINRDNMDFSIELIKNTDNIAMKIKNKITVKQILSMKVKKNKLEVKYRTRENIDNISNCSLKNKKEELVSSKIKKVGKKTFIGYYKSKDLQSFINTSLEKGLSIIINMNEKEYTTEVSQLNKHTIYYNKLDFIRNTNKYKKICSKLYERAFLKLPVKKKRILFESFLGRNVSGNPKYIYDYMVETKLDKKYELVWILNDLDENITGKHKKVKRKSLKYYYYMATSGYWVFNARQADEIIKRKEITYLQTWHGTPLKRLASDMFNVDMGGVTDLNEYKEKFFRNSSRWDYLLAQNNYSADIFQRAFNFNKEMIYGYPANDILYKNNNQDDINKLKEKFNIPKDKKVILYAPTWREDNFFKKGHYKMSLQLELEKMQESLGREYVVLIRAHYLIASSLDISDYKGFVYDFSGSYDIQELYLVSDILITDYSSVMFDFANLKRPMIFFMYDLEKYRDTLRGFYFDFEEMAPGKINKTTDEIIGTILNIDDINKEYKEKYEAFYNKFCHVDKGNSAKHVIEKILK